MVYKLCGIYFGSCLLGDFEFELFSSCYVIQWNDMLYL